MIRNILQGSRLTLWEYSELCRSLRGDSFHPSFSLCCCLNWTADKLINWRVNKSVPVTVELIFLPSPPESGAESVSASKRLYLCVFQSYFRLTKKLYMGKLCALWDMFCFCPKRFFSAFFCLAGFFCLVLFFVCVCVGFFVFFLVFFMFVCFCFDFFLTFYFPWE